MISTDIVVWIQALLIIMFMSQLYKDNFLYRFSEYTLIGVSVGHGSVLVYNNIVSMVYTPITVKGEFILLVPILLGFLIWTRLSKRYGWVSRWPMAVILGVATALAVRGAVKTQIYDQIVATVNLAVIQPTALATVNNFITLVTAICTVMYFLYFKEQKGAYGLAAKIGRITLMATFGNGIAMLFTSRVASLLAQMQFLLLQWLGLR